MGEPIYGSGQPGGHILNGAYAKEIRKDDDRTLGSQKALDPLYKGGLSETPGRKENDISPGLRVRPEFLELLFPVAQRGIDRDFLQIEWVSHNMASWKYNY